MYVKSETGTERSLAIELVLEDIPGGGVVEKDDFPTAATSVVEAVLVGVDANGIYHICKTAELYEDETNTETGYKVLKGHQFVVGDFIADSALAGASEAITAIDTANANYDVLTVGTTLGHAMVDGECLIQTVDQQSAGSGVIKYSPVGITTNAIDLTADNTGAGIMVRGRVRASLMSATPVDASVKAISALSLIRFV